MKNNQLMIGQMAKLNHTTQATLRLYDEQGLLSPMSVDPVSGYRYYDVHQCTTFHLIQRNKILGLSLKEIKALLEHHDLGFLEETYRLKIIELEEKMEELQRMRKEMQDVLVWSDRFRHCPPAGTFSMEYVPRRYVYVQDVTRNYLQEDFGSVVYDLAKLETHLHGQGFHGLYPYDAFLTVNLESFRTQTYRVEKFGMRVHEEDAKKPGIQTVESSMSACVYFTDFRKFAEYLDQLHDYCQTHRYRPIGNVTCQILSVIDPNDFRKTSEHLRLQVPVATNA